MRDYMIALGTVMILTTLSKMLLPEGDIKKFASLAMGFMLICTVTAPLPNLVKGFAENAEIYFNEKSMAEAEAVYRAEIIKKHRENIAKLIEEKMSDGANAYVETTQQGEIIKVTLRVKNDESSAVAYIISQLGVPRERIKLIYENN